ncbi:hypothetical protein MIND_00310400 [Mycena indigotica]|uniref:Uncharacterized protein n=1 Tax=Mycena indigotica TaxID=2126181 RepID=A0A8H6T1N5_9AGAR|nr:uncharacterized protein MIND_00310400 [Mycena indigotica]KAF7309396.1 hypothetical protein MIND_00310400 [Mycena indigotica]
MPQLRAFTGGSEESSSPVLPPEIEREIFEVAAQIPGNATTLALVARRTQIWMERIIYETVTLSSPNLTARFLTALDSRPAQFFTELVKSLCIPGDIPLQSAIRVLQACQGVVNLALWLPLQATPLLPYIGNIRPRRLSVNVSGLFGAKNPLQLEHKQQDDTSTPDFTHPFFSCVTHLELVDWLLPLFLSNSTLNLPLLAPHLTHLALDVDPCVDASALVRLRVQSILRSCRSLVICLGVVDDDDTMIVACDELSEVSRDDPRLVILSDADVVTSWEDSVRGTDASIWAFAEDIVSARIGKKLKL